MANFCAEVKTGFLKKWALFLLTALLCGFLHAKDSGRADTVALVHLPPEARQTLELVKRGGPYPYAKDGSVFGNYERNLPVRPRGYYREYTVPTPGARNRGARRLVVGGQPPASAEYFYTGDHYRTFRRIRE